MENKDRSPVSGAESLAKDLRGHFRKTLISVSHKLQYTSVEADGTRTPITVIDIPPALIHHADYLVRIGAVIENYSVSKN